MRLRSPLAVSQRNVIHAHEREIRMHTGYVSGKEGAYEPDRAGGCAVCSHLPILRPANQGGGGSACAVGIMLFAEHVRSHCNGMNA